MEIKAKVKHLRVSARKARLVVNTVRGVAVTKALDQLQFTNKKVAEPIAKLIKSAVANAENTYEFEKDNLFIKEIRVDEGVTLKRWMPRAHGRATTIRKRASHISVVLAEIKPSGKKAKKLVKAEAPIKLDKMSEEKTPKDSKDKKETKTEDTSEEKAKEIKDEVSGPSKGDGSKKGFTAKVFRRKAG